MYDIEMMQEIGFCQGYRKLFKNIISGRAPGSAPYTLLDYFPDDYLMIIDESHVTIPQCVRCITVTEPEKKRLLNTVSVCRVRLITDL